MDYSIICDNKFEITISRALLSKFIRPEIISGLITNFEGKDAILATTYDRASVLLLLTYMDTGIVTIYGPEFKFLTRSIDLAEEWEISGYIANFTGAILTNFGPEQMINLLSHITGAISPTRTKLANQIIFYISAKICDQLLSEDTKEIVRLIISRLNEEISARIIDSCKKMILSQKCSHLEDSTNTIPQPATEGPN